MAESRTYRFKFWSTSAILIAILAAILIVLAFVGDRLSRYKIDLTEDRIYTISEHFAKILSRLKEKVTVTYYVSEELPSVLLNLRRDTRDMFDEIRSLSGGKVEFKEVVPDTWAAEEARKDVARYKEKKAKGEKPEEPKAPETFEDLLSGRGQTQKTPEDIAQKRETEAKARAKALGRNWEDEYYEMLSAEWKRVHLDTLEKEGIIPFRFQERQGSNIREVSFFSSLVLSYLDQEKETITQYFQIQSIELELATRILKLTSKVKPNVVFFDGRAPEAPPFDPSNPMRQPPRSDFQGGLMALLQEYFNVETTKLKEGDTLADVLGKLRERAAEERKKSKRKAAKEKEAESPEPELACLIVAQPDALQERQVYEISKAISEGIPTIFLVSRHSLDVAGGTQSGYTIQFLQPGLDDLFRSFGLTLGRDIIGSNRCSNLPALVNLGGLRVVAPYQFSVAVLASGSEGLVNDRAALTNRIPGLVFLATNGFTTDSEQLKKSGLEAEWLARTSPQSWAVQVTPFAMGMFNRGGPPSLFQQYRKDLIDKKNPGSDSSEFIEQKDLALLVTGKFPFLYQGKEIPEWKKEEPKKEGEANLDPQLPPGLRGSGGPAGPQEGPAGAAGAAPPAGSPPPGPGQAPQEGVSGEEAGKAPAVEPAESPGEKPGEKQGEKPAEQAPPPAEKPKGDVKPVDGKVLFVSTVDGFKDEVLSLMGQGRPFSDYNSNMMFFQNAVETFGLGDELIHIRRKQITDRYFEGADNFKQNIIYAINIVLVPLLVTMLGLAWYIWRRLEANAYTRQFLGRAAR